MMRRFICFLGITALLGTATFGQGEDQIWSLLECINHARDHNLQLQLSKLDLDNQDINLKQAQAARYPSVNASVRPSVSFGRTIDPTQYTFTDQRFDALNGSVNASVTLFDGFRISRTIQQNQLSLAATQKQYEQQINDLDLNVAVSYLNVLLQIELLESARLQRTSTAEQRDRTAKLVKAGSLAPADLAQLDAQLATEDLNVVRANNQLTLARLSLQQLLLLNPNEPFQIERPEIPIPDSLALLPDPNTLYQTAAPLQPGIRAAELNIQQAAMGIEVAKSNYYPTVSLIGSLNSGWSSSRQNQIVNFVQDTSNFIINGQEVEVVSEQPQVTRTPFPFLDQLQDNFSYGLALQLSVPIYQNRFARTSVERAKIGMEQAQIQATQQQQQLEQTLQQAFVDAQNALITYQATDRQVAALSLSYENLNRQFELGAANAVEVLVAKNNLNQARLDLVRAKYDFVFRTKVLDFYQGKPIQLN